MVPSAIHVRNYRSFAGPQPLELRPLTLLYGENSAGKSALVRLLPLLADSLGAEEGGPLNLSSAAARGSTYNDLRRKGLSEDESRELSLSLEWRGDPELTRANFSLDVERSWQRLVIKHFEFLGGEGQRLLSGQWQFRADQQQAPALTYRLESSGGPLEVPVHFKGLVPEVPPGAPDPAWALLRTRLMGLRRTVQWLGSRHPESRISPRPSTPVWTMQPDGSDVSAVLASQPELRAEVSRWFEQNLQRALEISEVPPTHFRVTLRHLARATLDVDLADAGEGVLKVLPVLTALALSGRPAPTAPRILAIEEPESHLHPRLQRALSEHIATTVSSRSAPPCIVLETHSQHILLGVQIEVARRRLDPNQVQVYWVHQDEEGRSLAEPVRLDEEGRLRGNWPSDVYSEVHDMAEELLLARRERPRS